MHRRQYAEQGIVAPCLPGWGGGGVCRIRGRPGTGRPPPGSRQLHGTLPGREDKQTHKKGRWPGGTAWLTRSKPCAPSCPSLKLGNQNVPARQVSIKARNSSGHGREPGLGGHRPSGHFASSSTLADAVPELLAACSSCHLLMPAVPPDHAGPVGSVELVDDEAVP